MTALAAPFFIGERLSTTQKLGLCLGFLGVLIAVLPKFFGQGAAEIPALAILVNMLGMAAVTYGTIYQKQHLQTGDIRAVATLCPSSNDLRLFGLWKNGVSGSVCGLI